MRLVTSGKPITFQNTSASQIAGNNTVSKKACLHIEECLVSDEKILTLIKPSIFKFNNYSILNEQIQTKYLVSYYLIKLQYNCLCQVDSVHGKILKDKRI